MISWLAELGWAELLVEQWVGTKDTLDVIIWLLQGAPMNSCLTV